MDAVNDKPLGSLMEDDMARKRKSRMRRLVTRTVDEQLFVKNPSGKSDAKALSYKVDTGEQLEEELDLFRSDHKLDRTLLKSKTNRCK